MPPLHEKLLAERDALIAEIHAAFKHIKRGRGVSWLETDVLDDYGTEQECKAARAKDPEQHWPTLVNNPNWDHDKTYGGWAFLDPEGFRYYLPPAMVREALNDDPYGASPFMFSLTFPKPAKDPKRDLREHTLKKWSMLDDRQRRCVKRFLEYKVACARAHHDAETAELGYENGPFRSEWLTALNSYWASIPDE